MTPRLTSHVTKPCTRFRTILSPRHPSTARAFHASPHPQFLTTVLSSTHDLLVGFHSVTSLPWVLTLPLTALGIRLVFLLPLEVYLRRARQRRLDMQPLRVAWGAVFRRAVNKNSGHLGPALAVREGKLKMFRKTLELNRRWNCGVWKEFLHILYFPFWLAIIETVRDMCGAPNGLLGLLIEAAGNAVPAIKTAAVFSQEPAVQSVPETLLEAGQVAIPTANVQSESVVSTVFEPSMVTEGMLWFPNLAIPDPMHILPFMLSATLLLGIYNAGSKRLLPDKEPLWRKRLRRVMTTVALAAGPLTLEMPSAVLLYWISSAAMGYGQHILLGMWIPLRGPIKPCGPKVQSPK